MRIEADEISEFDPRPRFEDIRQPDTLLHQSIFSGVGTDLNFSGKNVAQQNRAADDQRVEMIFSRTNNQKQPIIAGSRASGSGRVDIEISWGGSEGTKTEVTVSGEISHDSGAYVEASASQDSSGQGSASVDVGVDTKPDK